MTLSRRRFLGGTAAGLALWRYFRQHALPPRRPRVRRRDGARRSMQLGWIANVEYMGMFIADDAGYYADEGLGMTIEPGGPAISVAPIVASGKALVGLDSTDTIARARAEGAKLKVIGAELQRNPTSVMSLPPTRSRRRRTSSARNSASSRTATRSSRRSSRPTMSTPRT